MRRENKIKPLFWVSIMVCTLILAFGFSANVSAGEPAKNKRLPVSIKYELPEGKSLKVRETELDNFEYLSILDQEGAKLTLTYSDQTEEVYTCKKEVDEADPSSSWFSWELPGVGRLQGTLDYSVPAEWNKEGSNEITITFHSYEDDAEELSTKANVMVVALNNIEYTAPEGKPIRLVKTESYEDYDLFDLLFVDGGEVSFIYSDSDFNETYRYVEDSDGATSFSFVENGTINYDNHMFGDIECTLKGELTGEEGIIVITWYSSDESITKLCEYTVKVLEVNVGDYISTVFKPATDPVILIANKDGKIYKDGDTTYFRYNTFPKICQKGATIECTRITDINGTKVTDIYHYDRYDEKNSRAIFVNESDQTDLIVIYDSDVDDNQYYEHWKVGGTYTAFVEVDGTPCPFTVKIIEAEETSPTPPPALPPSSNPEPASAPGPAASAPAATTPAVGSTVNVGSQKYKIATASTVTFTKAKKGKKATVPASIKVKGKTYKVSGIAKYAFKGTKTQAVTIKSKLLTKKSVKNCLKGSKVKTISVKVGNKKMNKKYIKKYKKIFTRKICGAKVKVQ